MGEMKKDDDKKKDKVEEKEMKKDDDKKKEKEGGITKKQEKVAEKIATDTEKTGKQALEMSKNVNKKTSSIDGGKNIDCTKITKTLLAEKDQSKLSTSSKGHVNNLNTGKKDDSTAKGSLNIKLKEDLASDSKLKPISASIQTIKNNSLTSKPNPLPSSLSQGKNDVKGVEHDKTNLSFSSATMGTKVSEKQAPSSSSSGNKNSKIETATENDSKSKEKPPTVLTSTVKPNNDKKNSKDPSSATTATQHLAERKSITSSSMESYRKKTRVELAKENMVLGQKRRQLQQTLMQTDVELDRLKHDFERLKIESSVKSAKGEEKAIKIKACKALKEKIDKLSKDRKQLEDSLKNLDVMNRYVKELYLPKLTPEQRARVQILEDNKVKFEAKRRDMSYELYKLENSSRLRIDQSEMLTKNREKWMDNIRKVESEMKKIDIELRDLQHLNYTPEQLAKVEYSINLKKSLEQKENPNM